MPHATAVLPQNRLLRSLAPQDLARLRLRLETFSLTPKRVLHHARLPIKHVYFVESGLVSVMASTDGANHGIEAWLVGHEGMVGLPVVLGMETSPHRRMVQVEGSALRMTAADLRSAMDDLPSLRPVLLRYVNSILVQTSQSAVCNASHSLVQRLARWLLTAEDRLDRADLPVTHNLIATILGARRASITEGIHLLVANEVIAQERGVIRIRDPNRLEHLSCGCYRIMRIDLERLLLPKSAAWLSPDRQPAAGTTRPDDGPLELSRDVD